MRLVDHERRGARDGVVDVGVPPDLLAGALALLHRRDAPEEVVVAQRPDVDVVVEERVGRLDPAEGVRPGVVGEEELDPGPSRLVGAVQKAGVALGLEFLRPLGRLVEDVEVGLGVPAVLFVDPPHLGQVVADGARRGVLAPAPGEEAQQRQLVVVEVDAARVEERRHVGRPDPLLLHVARVRHLREVVHDGRRQAVLRHHRVEVGEHLDLVLAVEVEAAGQAALDVVLADGECSVRADLRPAEIPHAQAERDVGDLRAVHDVQRRRVGAGGRAERHVHEDVERRRAPGDALPGAEVARHERVGVRAAARAEVRRR